MPIRIDRLAAQRVQLDNALRGLADMLCLFRQFMADKRHTKTDKNRFPCNVRRDQRQTVGDRQQKHHRRATAMMSMPARSSIVAFREFEYTRTSNIFLTSFYC